MSKCAPQILLWTTTSSRYTAHPSSPATMVFIRRWNVAGAFLKPKLMTLYEYNPSYVINEEMRKDSVSQGHLPITLKQVKLADKPGSAHLSIQSSILRSRKLSVSALSLVCAEPEGFQTRWYLQVLHGLNSTLVQTVFGDAQGHFQGDKPPTCLHVSFSPEKHDREREKRLKCSLIGKPSPTSISCCMYRKYRKTNIGNS